MSWSVNPADFRWAAIFSAAAVQLPEESVVLVSTSSLYKARKATWSGRSGSIGGSWASASAWMARPRLNAATVRIGMRAPVLIVCSDDPTPRRGSAMQRERARKVILSIFLEVVLGSGLVRSG